MTQDHEMPGDARSRVDVAIAAMPVRAILGSEPMRLLPGIRVSRADIVGSSSVMPATRRFRKALNHVLECVAQPRFDPSDGSTSYDRGGPAARATADGMGPDSETILHFSRKGLAELGMRDAEALGALEHVGRAAQARGPNNGRARHDPYAEDVALFETTAAARASIARASLGILEARGFGAEELVAFPVQRNELAPVPRGSSAVASQRTALALHEFAGAVRQPVYGRDGAFTGEVVHGRRGMEMLELGFGDAGVRRLWLSPDAAGAIAARRGSTGLAQASILAEVGASRSRTIEARTRPEKSRNARESHGLG